MFLSDFFIDPSCFVSIQFSMKELSRLWSHAGLPLEALTRLQLTGKSYLPSSFDISSAATISIALTALAASEIHRLRTASTSTVTIDQRDACAEFECHSIYKPDINLPSPSLWDPISGLYSTKDGYIRLHANFPHHRYGLLQLLGLPTSATSEQVASTLLQWKAAEFEQIATDNGMCAAALRSPEDGKIIPWLNTLQILMPLMAMFHL
ncbi:carnitine dehydratase, partial [Thraustotheca clavata]